LPVAESVLRATRSFRELLRRHRELIATAGDFGSNNWVVSAGSSETGRPLLANDPHLALRSPPLFFMCHLNTARARPSDGFDISGLQFPGLPGVLLGYNRDIAWGLTTTGFDVTDYYLETITEGADGEPDTVLFEGRQVPIQIVTEMIDNGRGGQVRVEFEVVPHHGPIIPVIRDGQVVPREGNTAISVRWTGFEPSSEVTALLGISRARTVADAREALRAFENGNQNWVVITRDGHIFWKAPSRVPVRDPRAMTFDPATGEGIGPNLVLSGAGEHEWIGDVPYDELPELEDPRLGYIATANQDQVGNTADDNPFNDEHYFAILQDPGFRQARIRELISSSMPRSRAVAA
jgi:penicillin amidase